MDESLLYEHILGVTKPWFVEHIELIEKTVHVYVAHDFHVALSCPMCGDACTRYDSKPRTWRHLDTCQFQTIVHCDIPRTDCPEHGALQVNVPWAEKGGRFTHLFESLVIDWLQEATVNAVARRFGLSWNAVDGIMQRATIRGLQRRQTLNLAHLSVDEVSQKKGHNYVTIISNSEGHVIDVHDGKSKDSLNAFYAGLSTEQLSTIKTVSMDMSPSYIYSTKEWLSDAQSKICFDKFHVFQDLNKAVDGVRKAEMHSIDNVHRGQLHRSRFMWLRNQSNLTDYHRQIKDELSRVALKTARAWAILQYAKTLWDFDDIAVAKTAWLKWHSWAVKSRLMPMKTVAKSIKEKLWGIINAIVYKRTNASAESINAKLKMVKVRAKGFRSEQRYRTAILFHLGGLQLKP